jgi:hypothetical protein
MRVLVCGGRTFSDAELLCGMLNHLKERFPDISIIHGAARGADQLAGAWAHENNVSCVAFPANWDAYGRSAGHVRNGEMLSRGKPDLVVAFPGGRGTANMIEQATQAGVKVINVAGT